MIILFLQNDEKISFKFKVDEENGGLKGTVSVISNDPPCLDAKTQFTTVPLKAFSYHV